MGKEGKYDLALAAPPSPVTSDPETEDTSENGGQLTKDNQLINFLRDACVNLLRNVTLCAGLHLQENYQSTIHGLSSLFYSMIKTKYQGDQTNILTKTHSNDWCTLSLVRSIAQSEEMCRSLSSRNWIDLLLKIASSRNQSDVRLPQQIQALRVLQTVLPAWDLDNSNIPPVLEKLLNILGMIVLTCVYDNSQSGGDSKAFVFLTQSYSSTLAQEIITLLRKLHGIVGWNQVLNAILLQQLNFAAEYISSGSLSTMFNEINTSDQHYYMMIAALCVIGGVDTRPRIGAAIEIENNIGTICRVSMRAKLCIQMHETAELKKLPLTNLKMSPEIVFNLDKIPLSESMTKIWSALLLNKYGTSTINYEKRPTNLPGHINVSYLRSQQHMLGSLNASRILFGYQHKLRRILRYHMSAIDQSLEQITSDQDDAPPMLLIQKILTKAIQPSPLKAIFTTQEMLVAATNLSQFLATVCNNGTQFNKPSANNDKNNTAIVVPVCKESTSELPTPTSECSAQSVVSEKSSKKKKYAESGPALPGSPMITQLVEMGFRQKNVESAIKSFGVMPNVPLTPETVVAWLLEHPGNGSDSDSVSSFEDGSDTESITDQDEVASASFSGYVSFR